MQQNGARRGFTLIELSIVLVIIGLIVGGVLVGQNLIKAAGLRCIISEKDKITTAINAFRDKYGYLPGDYPNAYAMWGVEDDNGPAIGNGNGTIDDSSTGAPYPYFNEYYWVWLDLGAAQMMWTTIPNGYVSSCLLPGKDTPASAFGNGSGYSVMSNAAESASPTQFYNSSAYQNVLMFGAGYSGCPVALKNQYPVLTPADAYSIDKKIDDGLPASGNVITMGEYVPVGTWIADGNTVYNCTTTNVASTAQYLQSLTTPTCLLFFTNAW